MRHGAEGSRHTHLILSPGCPRHGVCAWVLGSLPVAQSLLFTLSDEGTVLLGLSSLCPLCSDLCELCALSDLCVSS